MPKQQWQPVEYKDIFTSGGKPFLPELEPICDAWRDFNYCKRDTADFEFSICRLVNVDVDTPQPMDAPDEVVSTLRNALALLKRDDEFYLAGRHEDEINAAIAWLDGLGEVQGE